MQAEIHHTPQWLTAVDRLYDAVGREQRLAEALGAFRPFFGAQAACFFTAPDPEQAEIAHTGAVGMNDQMLLEYRAHYSAHDEWLNAAVRSGDFRTGTVYRGSQLVQRRRLQQSYFGRQFLGRHGIADMLAAVVETGSDDGPTSWASFYRWRGQPPFARRDAVAMSALVPHMRQVLRLHRRLPPQLAVGTTLREFVQRLETPLVFVAADGRIVDRNLAAEAALTGSPGWLRDRAGRLVVAEGGRWQELSTWLPALGRGARRSLVLDLADDERRGATLEVLPIEGAAPDRGATHPAVAICRLRPGTQDRAQVLRRRFGLSAAEARIALQLADGRSPGAIAAALEVAITTVRSQIAAVRSKMGVTRQAQIVSAVLSL